VTDDDPTATTEADTMNDPDNDPTSDPGDDRSTRSSRGATGGATFRATRDELRGDDSLLGSAEIARTYCTSADRVTSVVAITPGRIRRVDCWLGGIGFVTHAASSDPGQATLGSVSDRDRASELTLALVDSLVGGTPSTSAAAPVELGNVGAITTDALPDGVEWVVIVSAASASAGARPERIVLAGRVDGLTMASLESLDTGVRADGATRDDLERRLAGMIGPAPRSVEDLLADDDG